MSVHVAESAEEVEFIGRGSGGLAGPAEAPGRVGSRLAGAPVQSDRVPRAPRVLGRADAGGARACRPAPRTWRCWLGAASRWSRARGATRGSAPACRRSRTFYRSGARVAIGTDSLTSVADLNLFSELAALRRLAPDVRPANLLEQRDAVGSASPRVRRDPRRDRTRHGAPRLIAVEVPPGTTDVEEYLVSGIEPGRVRWMRAEMSPLAERVFAPTRPSCAFQPLGVRAAVRADRGAAGVAARAAHAGPRRLDHRGDGGREKRGDGVQPARRRALRRAQPADRRAGTAGGPHVPAPRPCCFVAVASAVFVCGGLGRSARSASRCRRSPWPSSSGTRSRSASPGPRRRSWGSRWRSPRWAAGWPPAGAAAGSPGCWPWPSGPGWAGSTCSTRARTSSSTAAHGLHSIPQRFGVPASLAISRGLHVVTVVAWRARVGGAARADLPRRRGRRGRAARLRAVARVRRRTCRA